MSPLALWSLKPCSTRFRASSRLRGFSSMILQGLLRGGPTDLKVARAMIDLIGTERHRRSGRLKNEDPDFAYDQWLFIDEPFINDMCLLALVALRHQVERELIMLAARASAGPAITRQQYQENVLKLREKARTGKGWKDVVATLNLASFPEWGTALETLRLLANCLKHEPTQEPDQKLLKHLRLPLKPPGQLNVVCYAPLSESSCFREGLAASVKLPADADYCAIADAFVEAANQLLENVRRKTTLARITGAVSLVEFSA